MQVNIHTDMYANADCASGLLHPYALCWLSKSNRQRQWWWRRQRPSKISTVAACAWKLQNGRQRNTLEWTKKHIQINTIFHLSHSLTFTYFQLYLLTIAAAVVLCLNQNWSALPSIIFRFLRADFADSVNTYTHARRPLSKNHSHTYTQSKYKCIWKTIEHLL